LKAAVQVSSRMLVGRAFHADGPDEWERSHQISYEGVVRRQTALSRSQTLRL